MSSGGLPSGGVTKVYGKRGDLPIDHAKPNSRYDLYVKGKRVQSRWYDHNGNAVRNRDFDHQDAHHNHKFPHDHIWKDKGKYIDRHGRIREKLIRDEDDWVDPDETKYPS